jgi:hypothetical protein
VPRPRRSLSYDRKRLAKSAAQAASNIVIAAMPQSADLLLPKAAPLERAALALLDSEEQQLAKDAASLLGAFLIVRGPSRGGRRLASSARLYSGLSELFRNAADRHEGDPAWSSVAIGGLLLLMRAGWTLLSTYGDGEVARAAVLLRRLAAAATASCALSSARLMGDAATAKICENTVSQIWAMARNAMEGAPMPNQTQRQQQQQQQEQQEQQEQREGQQQRQRRHEEEEDEEDSEEEWEVLEDEEGGEDADELDRPRACAVCGRTRADGASLRRCRGCGAVTLVRYCSQACCEAHWVKRRHRRLCEMGQAVMALNAVIQEMREADSRSPPDGQ